MENYEDEDCIGYRICSHCGKKMEEGYVIGDDFACSDECAIALYKEKWGETEENFKKDLEEEEKHFDSTGVYYTDWYGEEE